MSKNFTVQDLVVALAATEGLDCTNYAAYICDCTDGHSVIKPLWDVAYDSEKKILIIHGAYLPHIRGDV